MFYLPSLVINLENEVEINLPQWNFQVAEFQFINDEITPEAKLLTRISH